MRSSRTPITLSPAARLLMGFCIGLSVPTGTAISRYLAESYGLRHPAMMIGIGIVAPLLLMLFVILLFHLRARTQPARRWPTVVLAGILLVEIPIYLCWTIYLFRPCSWLDLPRRLNGCAAVTALSKQESGLFRYADTSAGSLITDEGRLLGWLADPSLSPISGEKPLQALAVSPTAQLVAFARGDGIVELRQLTTGAIYTQLPTDSKEITGLTFTADGQGLLVANGSPELQLWDIRT